MSPALSSIFKFLHLLLLLLTPLWLSLAVDELNLYRFLPSALTELRRGSPNADNALAPPPDWQEKAYLAANPDVAAAVKNGAYTTGYSHYVQNGHAEGRRGGFANETAPSLEPTPASAAAVLTPPSPVPAPPPPPAQEPAAKPPLHNTLQGITPAVRGAPASDVVPASAKAEPGNERTMDSPIAQQGLRYVERIRTANRDTGLRIVLDLDQTPQFKTPVQRPDGQLEVTLPGTSWQAPRSGRLPATALIYRIERNGNDVRLLLAAEKDKAKGSKPESLQLIAISPIAPDKDRGHRLLIEVALSPKMKSAHKGY